MRSIMTCGTLAIHYSAIYFTVVAYFLFFIFLVFAVQSVKLEGVISCMSTYQGPASNISETDRFSMLLPKLELFGSHILSYC
jgi:hypothetical protein